MQSKFGKVTHNAKQLIGRTVMIAKDNDNENYDPWRDKQLIITDADNKGRGYDDSVYPEMLCSFKLRDGGEFPFSLYEYEFFLL